MNFGVLFVVLLACVQAASIPHDQVRPFAQRDPITVSEKAAIKFKPQLKVSEGCHPYPAVQEDGSLTGGLKWSGKQDGECKGSGLGSQIYSRSTWYNDVWAIMYTWYFPKGSESDGGLGASHRHNWEYVIVWIDNPELNNPTIKAVTISEKTGYRSQAPPDQYLNGTSLKVAYYYASFLFHETALKFTEEAGEFQELITWEQLPEVARGALNNTGWEIKAYTGESVIMPLIDSAFTEHLEKAWPF